MTAMIDDAVKDENKRRMRIIGAVKELKVLLVVTVLVFLASATTAYVSEVGLQV